MGLLALLVGAAVLLRLYVWLRSLSTGILEDNRLQSGSRAYYNFAQKATLIETPPREFLIVPSPQHPSGIEVFNTAALKIFRPAPLVGVALESPKIDRQREPHVQWHDHAVAFYDPEGHRIEVLHV